MRKRPSYYACYVVAAGSLLQLDLNDPKQHFCL